MWDILISGGFTAISNFLHSLMSVTILSMLDISLVRLADMNSTGKNVFNQAV